MLRLLMGVIGFVVAILLAGGAGGATVMYLASGYLPAPERTDDITPPAPTQTPTPGPASQCLSRDDVGAIYEFTAELAGQPDLPMPDQLTDANACFGISQVISISCQHVNGGYGRKNLCAEL